MAVSMLDTTVYFLHIDSLLKLMDFMQGSAL